MNVFQTNRTSYFTYTPSGLVVQCSQILGTENWVVTVWERDSSLGSHSTITTFNGEWYGTLASRDFNCDLPVGPERSAAVRAKYDQAKAESLAAFASVMVVPPNAQVDDTEITWRETTPQWLETPNFIKVR